MNVGEIAKKLEDMKANASKHLALMRMQRILTARREGTNVYYGIANEKIYQACSLVQEGLEQRRECFVIGDIRRLKGDK